MKRFLGIILVIFVVVGYVDQRVQTYLLSNEAMEREKELYLALTLAGKCKASLRSNMEFSRINEAKLRQMVEGLGLIPEDNFVSMGGE